jgi:transposase
LELLDQLTPQIQKLTQALEAEVEKRAVAQRLMTHPGVGPQTALAFELVIGTPDRFHCGKQIASYVGLVPEENSSGDRRRLGHISKQGNAVTHYFAFCWWKQHRPQYAANHSGRVGSFILL